MQSFRTKLPGRPARPCSVLSAAVLLLLSSGSVRAANDAAPCPLTLEQAVAAALARSPEVSATRWDAAAAAAQTDAARAQRLPQVKLSGSYSYATEDQRLFPAAYNGETGVFGSGIAEGAVVLTLPLYTGGKLSHQTAAAELLQQAAAGDLTRTREIAAFNVTSLFYSLLAQKEVIASVESAITAMEAQRRSIQERVDLQKAAQVDVLRADVRLAELREQRTREINTQTVQQWTLAALLGLEDGRRLALTGSLELAEPPDCPDAAGCMQTALQNRQDYAAAGQRAAAGSESVRSARSGYLPSLSLESSYGLKWMSDVTDSFDGADDSQWVGQIGLAAEWPLFSGGAARAEVRRQAAVQQAALERERQLRLRIRTEVETALADVSSAAERVETTETAVQAARESFRIIEEKYELGKGAMVDVLTAQAALTAAETSYARARADLAISAARRKLAVGEILP